MTAARRLLITGGAGFIGSNFVRHMLSGGREVEITNLDKLTYAGNLENLADLEADARYEFVRGDIADASLVRSVLERIDPYAIVNFAAESHVDRSILGALPFVETNVRGTLVLLEAAKEAWSGHESEHRFVQISTDEVYGDLGATGSFSETTPLNPNNPYAASKASADLLCLSYFRTHGLPVMITRCSNNYGPYQFPEKLIPVMVDKASKGESLPVYGDGSNIRDWIHVTDHCRAIDRVVEKGRPGEVYNIGAGTEIRNIDLVKMIVASLGQSEDLIEFVRDRPGHDARYSIDASKITRELGWMPRVAFREGLEATVAWYVEQTGWVERCKSGEYQEYWARNYEHR